MIKPPDGEPLRGCGHPGRGQQSGSINGPPACVRTIRRIWPLVLAGLAGCSSSEDPVVARVGSHEIRTSRLREFVTQLPEGLRINVTGDAARRRYLQDLIDRRLLLMEGRALGLDTSEVVQNAVAEAVNKRASVLYSSREMTGDTEISPEEVQHAFVEKGYDRERKLSAILVENRQELARVLEEIEAGEEFSDIARKYSLDEASAHRGGELGFVGPDMARRLRVPLDVFLSLPQGQVSVPLASGSRWHIVKFTEERPIAFAQVSSLLEARLRSERSGDAVDAHYEQLEKRFRVSLEPDGIVELVAAYRSRTPRALTGSPIPLYRYDEGSLTVGWVQARLAKMNRTQGLADSAQAIPTLRRVVLRPFLLAEAARRSGIFDEPEVRQYAERQRQDSELEELRRVVIKARVDPSEEEIRHYYDENPELFHHEQSVWAEELLLADESQAWQMRRQIEEGMAFAALAEHSLRHDASGQKALYHYHPREKILYPDLVPALLEAPQGQLEGPVKMAGGYSVSRVLRREEGGVEPFAVARRRAGGLLRRRLEAGALDSLMNVLRGRYESEVSIDGSRLKDALPDEVLGD